MCSSSPRKSRAVARRTITEKDERQIEQGGASENSEKQIEEIRARKVKKRMENLAKDREYLRQHEVLETERIAEENFQRQKT